MRMLAGLVALLFAVAGAASAADPALTAADAKRFVETLDAVDALAEKLRSDGTTDQLSIETRPKAGESFKPYSGAVAALKAKFPAEHARLAAAVKPQGFNPAQWGDVGDRVIIAYLALRMQEESPQGMAAMNNMDPSMLAMMPPEVKAQFEAARVMMETVASAPAADRAAVATVRADLDAYMNRQEARAVHAH